MPTFNLADLFELVADTVPDRRAITDGHHGLTYRQLDERASAAANALIAAGVGPGDHVAVLSPNRIGWLETFLGAAKARAAVVNVNHRYTSDEVLDLLVDSGARVLVSDPDLLEDLSDQLDAAPTLRGVITFDRSVDGSSIYEEALAAAGSTRPPGPRSPDDPYLLYTGGTTGRPKGVLWRSEDIFFAALSGGRPGGDPISEPAEIAAVVTDRPRPWLVTSPLMHGNGQWNSLVPLLGGHGVILWTGRRFDGARIAELAAAEGAGLLVLVGDGMALPFLEALDAAETAPDLSGLRVIASGGAILSPAVKDRLGAHLPRATVVDGFGASETGSSGRLVGRGDGGPPRFAMSPDTAVLDEELRPVATGEIGRLARRGHVPLAYLGDPTKTAETFPVDADGVRWAIPGDLARPEADGTITLLGRGSSCINTGGEKVYPDEVASAVKTHPAIGDAVVVGAPHERFGQEVVAVVTTNSSTRPDIEDVRTHLRPLLAGYKAPRRLIVVPEIRYTPQGKPDLAWAGTIAAGGAA